MKIIQLDLNNKKQKDDFLRLPFHIYRDIPQWVPPLQSDERLRLNPKRYPFYKHSLAGFFLACEGARPIGRLAILDPYQYNQIAGQSSGTFYMFECENNLEAATALFNAGFDWARSRGLNKIYGPKGFTPLDGFGLLVKGFEHRPAFGLSYNPNHYVDLIEAQGFVKEAESVSGYLDAHTPIPGRIHQLAERLAQRRRLHILRCNTRSELRALIPHLKELYNAGMGVTDETLTIAADDVDMVANQLVWLADPKLIKVVMHNEKPVGFLLAYPDVSAALQKSRGRLFPLGWLDLIRESRRTEWINVNGMALLPEYRGSGGTAILYSEMFKSVNGNPRYKYIDIVQIGVENDNMQREMENFGVDFYKTHRTYVKELN